MQKQIINLTKQNITLEEEYINSVDLVTIINYFRAIEREQGLTGRLQNPLQHKDLLKKIRKEVETLKLLGLKGESEFTPSSYINSQNKTQPCYKLNRDGVLQILNGESVLVRYKTIEYINQLEQQNEELKEDNKALYDVAVSDEDLAIREYEANRVKFAVRNIDRLLSDCDYTNIEKTVDDILDFHTNQLKKKDRYEYHKQLDDTEYKQLVRKKIKEKLDKLMINKQDLMLTMVAKTVQLQLESEAHSTTKRSTSHKSTSLTKEIKKLQSEVSPLKELNDWYKYSNNELQKSVNKLQPPLLENMIDVPLHGMSCNYLFKYDSQFGMTKTSTYKKWINDFSMIYELSELPKKEDWEEYNNVDFTKPIELYIKYICKEAFDNSNFDKATIDMLFNRIFKVDDNIVHKVISEKIATCDSYADGHIFYYIKNV